MPIINVEGIGRIEFPDAMSREQIDDTIKNEILPAFRLRIAQASATALSANTSIAPNPFSGGTAVADGRFSVGDSYRYTISDLLTKMETRRRTETVTEVSDSEVAYNGGRMTTDLLGNYIIDDRGRLLTESQYFVSEYSVGKHWHTRVLLTRGGGGGDGRPRGKRSLTRFKEDTDEVELDFRVLAREKITVPAGTFDAVKVEGQGFVRNAGANWRYVYWIAPEKVRRFIALEYTNSGRRGGLIIADRYELTSFRQNV